MKRFVIRLFLLALSTIALVPRSSRAKEAKELWSFSNNAQRLAHELLAGKGAIVSRLVAIFPQRPQKMEDLNHSFFSNPQKIQDMNGARDEILSLGLANSKIYASAIGSLIATDSSSMQEEGGIITRLIAKEKASLQRALKSKNDAQLKDLATCVDKTFPIVRSLLPKVLLPTDQTQATTLLDAAQRVWNVMGADLRSRTGDQLQPIGSFVSKVMPTPQAAGVWSSLIKPSPVTDTQIDTFLRTLGDVWQRKGLKSQQYTSWCVFANDLQLN